MTEALAIGVLEAAEQDAAVALWTAVGLTRPWNDPLADLRRARDGATSTVLAGRLTGRLVATAMVGSDGHRGWVYYLAVDPDRRGQGHGAAMMRAAEAWLSARGVPRLNLMVRAANADVIAFYEAQGYRRSDVVVLQRNLPAEDA